MITYTKFVGKYPISGTMLDDLDSVIAQAVAAEREACAKVAEERDLHVNDNAEGEHNKIERAKDRIARSIAAAIRSRK